MCVTKRWWRSNLLWLACLLLLGGCAMSSGGRNDGQPTQGATVAADGAAATETAPAVPTATAREAAVPEPAATTTLAPAVSPAPSVENAVREVYDQTADPVGMLASYFNAVNRREYDRAWRYWESPPNPSYEDFVAGYAETVDVLLVVRPPIVTEGAAGSQYTAIPSLLVATHEDGTRHAYEGCYVARRSTVEDEASAWALFSADVDPVAGEVGDARLLEGACAGTAPGGGEVAYDDRSTPLRLLTSYYNAINRQEYERAWEYWGHHPRPVSALFVKDGPEIGSVLLVVRPPALVEGAAGSQYASIPTMLFATYADGSWRTLVGCTVAQRANPEIEGAPPGGEWSLFGETLWVEPDEAADVTKLEQACLEQ